jgi:pyrimidine operon attenuation protein / uracil phosphoribosyltransferase
MSQRIVLDAQDIERCLKRIAHEILEANEGHQDLIILGIPTRGTFLANRIAKLISSIEPDYKVAAGVLDITMYRDDLVSKERKMSPTEIPTSGLDDKVVVLVDDVLYSGRTVRAALDAITDIGRPRQVKLAVLADRGHRELPIRPDFVGKNLPTSTKERVSVFLTESDGEDKVVIGQ